MESKDYSGGIIQIMMNPYKIYSETLKIRLVKHTYENLEESFYVILHEKAKFKNCIKNIILGKIC